MYNFAYSTREYPFCQIVGDMLNCHNLMLLHEQQKEEYDIATPGNDQGTEFHKMFYAACTDDSAFMQLYRKLVVEMGKVHFGDYSGSSCLNELSTEFLYQRVPTFRVQLPNNKAVGGTSHRDKDYNHPSKEVNFLVPLTSMIGSNSLFTESLEGYRDFSIKELHPNQVFSFDGANLEHGNMPNISGWTRVSFDFRLLHAEYARDLPPKSSVSHGLRFIEGEYYSSSSTL